MNDLRRINGIIDATLIHFQFPDMCTSKYYITRTIGNACYTHFADDHYTIQHELSSGGRVVIDVKYEPDWEHEDDTE